jgi:hypothetical protein
MTGCPPDDSFTRLVEGRLDDHEVRALEAHADGCPTCARVLAELARAVAPAGADWLGERYRLLEPLGAGGMGIVYAAFDDKLGRKVAVKRLRETGLGSSAEKRRARFLREAQLLASLSHPNVMTVFDVGGADRELYVVMELVDGWPVSRWAAETRPDWRRIVDVYLQAGRGLVAAHELGIVHRDVKPDNILVARSGRVLVSDFGLAGLTDTVTPIDSPSPAPGSGPLTETGAVLGTPAYMAPEQHAGRPGDAFSDQFSFCIALYETLHGRRPFSGRTASEIAAATRAGELTFGRDGIPRAIDRLLARGLDPEPARRFPSMGALLAALERARTRRRAPAAALALAGVVTVVGVGFAIWRGAGPRTHVALPLPTTPPATAMTTPAPKAPPAPATTAVATTTPPAPATKSGAAARASGPTPTGKRPPPRPGTKLARAGGPPGDTAASDDPTDPATPPTGAAGDPERALAHAAARAAVRDGAGCLAALETIGDWPPDLTQRAIEQRADCEMLRGNCEKGRAMLEPIYAADRTIAGVADGLLGARVTRHCPAASFPTVKQRVLAVYLQADLARQSPEKQPRWCGALEKTLLSDTQSAEVRGCFTASAGRARPSLPCAELLFDLAEAYRHLSECFLRDGDCREGAALDIMHGEVEMKSLAPDDAARSKIWCRPDAITERYHACGAEGKAAEARCLGEVEAARKAAGPPLLPKLPR